MRTRIYFDLVIDDGYDLYVYREYEGLIFFPEKMNISLPLGGDAVIGKPLFNIENDILEYNIYDINTNLSHDEVMESINEYKNVKCPLKVL